jgi:Asp-tRNA(Asn)/Glu-tRNA(Gln) amidotransferase A subunit family amidase
MKSIPNLLKELRVGTLSLSNYIDQTETIFNEREPDVLAFVPEAGRFDRLRREADALLAQYPNPAKRPPLFGLLVGVKDIFHVNGFETRAGSQLPPAILAGEESAAVTTLKNMGALMMGKTVTTEFAYFGAGPTRNPHHLGHTPGGSSSGSAAGVGAGLVPIAFGTQTIGSINRPAAYCGVVGYKPSYDRISRAGVIPLAPSLDHIGLMAVDVAGIFHVAPFIAKNWQTPAPDLDKPKLGIPVGAYLEHASPEGKRHFDGVCDHLRRQGYEVVEMPAFPDFQEIVDRHLLINARESYEVHTNWFAEFGELYHPKTAELLERGKTISPAALAAAKGGQTQLRHELTALMDEHGIDLWIAPPATATAPAGLTSTGNPIMNLPWSHCGLPTVNVPAGKGDNGLPLGVQFAGRWYDDERLLVWAMALEAAMVA